MSDDDRVRWDARHAAAGVPSPAPPGVLLGAPELTALFPTAGRALDVACGRGAVAVWLAVRGLVVDAVDVAPAGLAAGARLAAECGVDGRGTDGSSPRPAAAGVGRVRWIAHDLDAGLPPGCTGPYDVVVCQLFRDPSRYRDLVGALAPGGLLAVTVLSQVGAGPGPFRAAPGELRAAFGDLDVLLDCEGDGEATLLARAPRAGPPPGSRPMPPPPS